MSEKDTGKIVTFELDLDNPPPLTGEEREQMEHLRTMKDEDIDPSDIPEQTGVDNWTRPGLFGGRRQTASGSIEGKGAVSR